MLQMVSSQGFKEKKREKNLMVAIFNFDHHDLVIDAVKKTIGFLSHWFICGCADRLNPVEARTDSADVEPFF